MSQKRTPQVKLSLNAVENTVLARWAASKGSKPASWATFIVRRELEAASNRNEIPPAPADESVETEADMNAVLVHLITLIVEGDELTPTAIAQAARVAGVSPVELAKKLEKLNNSDGQ